MSSFKRARRPVVVPSWDRAMLLAGEWAWQLGRRFAVRSVRDGRGARAWIVTPATRRPDVR